MKGGADILAPILIHLICLSAETKHVPLPCEDCEHRSFAKKEKSINIPSIKDIRSIFLFKFLLQDMRKNNIVFCQEEFEWPVYSRPDQYDFRPGCSTSFVHIRLLNFITAELELISVVSILLISFDIRKICENLDHSAFVEDPYSKLHPHWLRSVVFRLPSSPVTKSCHWECAILTCRLQFACDGSIIGPSLFCLQMSIAKALRTVVLKNKYADDILLAIPISDNEIIGLIINDVVSNID